jgi:DNA-binding NtrC family response regulator
MTAHGTPDVLEEAIRSGAFAVLTKPFDMDSVVNLVGRADSKSGVT